MSSFFQVVISQNELKLLGSACGKMDCLKVTPTTFWLKYKNLPKCTKLCSTRKLEAAAKNFDLLTKNYLMHWQKQGPKGSTSGTFCVVCLNL